ncbi:MAG TPA: extracellular solute-binding protein, partial [Thermomicrobiales bacterium]|nr:extracellular solute-binding protein [Thermomicrobiales bacterium]
MKGAAPLVIVPHRSRPDQPFGQRRWSRRALLAGGIGLAGLSVGCGGDADAPATPVAFATPGMAVAGFDDPTRWRGRSVVAAAWGGEVQQALQTAVWQPFAKATGATVETTSTGYALLATPVAGQGGSYADLLLVDAIWAASPAAERWLRPLDADLLDGGRFDRYGASRISAPAFAYAMVGSYRRDAVGERTPPAGWTDWWDLARFPGARALGADPLGTLEFALLADGVEAGGLYPLDVDRALTSLGRIAGEIGDHWWTRGEEPVGWLGAGEVAFASAWHHRVVAGRWNGFDLPIVWRGGLLVADRWGIPQGARNADVAADLIRYALDPRVQAALAMTIPLSPVDPAAFPLIDPFVAATLPTDPSRIDLLVPLD